MSSLLSLASPSSGKAASKPSPSEQSAAFSGIGFDDVFAPRSYSRFLNPPRIPTATDQLHHQLVTYLESGRGRELLLPSAHHSLVHARLQKVYSFPHAGKNGDPKPLSPFETVWFKSAMAGVFGAGLGVVMSVLFSPNGMFGSRSFAAPLDPLPLPKAVTNMHPQPTSVPSLTSPSSLPLSAPKAQTPPVAPGFHNPGLSSFEASLDAAYHNSNGNGWSQAKSALKEMGTSAKSNAKTWGALGIVYTFSESTIEKARGQHDIYNPLLAGCATGGALSARAGPQAMAVGCAGFAAFSFGMEKLQKYMGM